LRVVHAVPDTFEDGRKRRDTDTSTNKHSDFELEDVFGGRAKGPVDVYTGKNLAQCNLVTVLAFPTLFVGLSFGAAAQSFAEGFGEVTDHTDMNGNVVFFGGARKRERVVLPDRHFGAAQKDVLFMSVS
jgi:hypothetical protein